MSAPAFARREALADDLRHRAFGAGSPAAAPRIGLEVELLPTHAGSGRPVPLRGGGSSSLELLRGLARERGWREGRSPTGSPRFEVQGGGALTFEPGGQIEFSSTPAESVDAAIHQTASVVEPLTSRARAEGIRLGTRGIDPHNGGDSAVLRVTSPRYRRLARHLDRIGPAGRRMMLQTAAIHVNLDLGAAPLLRWRTANAVVPELVAVFANSSRHGGEETGSRSYRAVQWRDLDPSRTGIFSDADPVRAYLEFALDAGAILLGEEGEEARPFREWLRRDGVGRREWRAHLDTLFPEVRPRGYLEIRAVDALPPRWYAAPLVFLAGILYDERSCRAALEVLDVPRDGELRSAARAGLGDPARAGRCLRLFDLALEGAERLGPDLVGGRALEVARAFRDRYTARGEDPAGDPEAGRA